MGRLQRKRNKDRAHTRADLEAGGRSLATDLVVAGAFATEYFVVTATETLPRASAQDRKHNETLLTDATEVYERVVAAWGAR